MLSLVFRTLLYFRNLLFPVAIGVAVAGAVIVGALVVGDSMRGSLRFIAMDRIGEIDSVVMGPRWFDDSLVDNIATPEMGKRSVHGLIIAQDAIIEHDTYRASEMTLMGVDNDFWSLGKIQPKHSIGDEEIVLNQTLADKLHVQVGDQVTLRVASQSVVPADNPLGKREQDTIVLPRWKVVEILPDASLARFSLRSDQRPIMNAFANKKFLQRALEIPSKVNSIVIAKDDSKDGRLEQHHWLEQLAPRLSDVGLRWERIHRSFPDSESESKMKSGDQPSGQTLSIAPTTIFDYYHVTTDQMLMTHKVVDAIVDATQSNKPSLVLTYLANGAQKLVDAKPVGRNVPYSTISGADWSLIHSMLTPTSLEKAPTDPNWVVVNRWLAEDLDLRVGDHLRIEYFLPETVDGIEVEKAEDLTIVAIAPLTEPIEPKSKVYGEAPTPFNDDAWTPVVPGVTDQESIDKWDTPFKLTRPREKQDDQYWDAHRLTPKLFVSHATAARLFGSRFGNASSIRYEGLDEERAKVIGNAITTAVRKQLTGLGWREIPLRKQQLLAANGTTPFDALFLSLSFFVIAAGLLLVALLFRLAIEQRADHWGLLMASGWTRSSVRRLLMLEGTIVAGVGSAMGVILGLGYAYAMLAGLRSWWVGAITVSFLDFHASPLSLFMGWVLGWLAAIATILVSTRQLRSISIARLLKRQLEPMVRPTQTKSGKPWAVGACILIAAAILLMGQFQQGQAQAGAFVGAGMLCLIGGLIGMHWRLRVVRADSGSIASTALLNASSLASSNAKRAPMRSILAIGLVAVASFLILSMSLFQSSPNVAGTGGFLFLGKSTSPIYNDLANAKYQFEILGSEMSALKDLDFVPFRVRGGDDASCNNLYQANEPQVLGVSPRMDLIDRTPEGPSAFAWFSKGTTDAKRTAWSLLEMPSEGTKESPVPVVLDQNTALWALHLGGYTGEQFSYTFDDRKVYFKTVGVLQNTILQGSLVIGERNFEKLFPSITGYRAFLIKARGVREGSLGHDAVEHARSVLENGWSESGLSLASSDAVLRQLLAVQNTYLGAFQVLGGLGLLLGTIGLGVAQLRSAMERRGELAAMRAIGFTKSRLVWLLTLENGWQLMRGIGIGVGASAFATLPAIFNGQPFSGFAWPLFMLAIVVATGMLCSILAAWGAMRWPLLGALRADK